MTENYSMLDGQLIACNTLEGVPLISQEKEQKNQHMLIPFQMQMSY